MNIGIIGMGKMGILHTGILSRLGGVKITAVTDKENLVKKHINIALPDAIIYDDYEKMISQGNLDLVYIATPVKFHVPIAMSCIENNVSFFMEKPLSSDMEECAKICNALKGKSIVHAVGYSKRFWDTFSKAKELINSQMLGDLIYVKSSMYISQLFAKGKGWRFSRKEGGGGVLLDLGVHVIDLLIWYFGKIKSVSGSTKSYYSGEVEDFTHASMEFENGMKGFLDISWSARGYRVPEISIEVQGSNGTMIVNDDNVRFRLDNASVGYPAGTTILYKQELSKGTIIDIGGTDFTKENIHMVECVMNGKQTLFNVFEASKTQSVVDAIYKSAAERKVKDVEYVI